MPESIADRNHILLVGNKPKITRMLYVSLTSCGYEVRITADGESIIDIFWDWHPDMIITDLSIPTMDGIELCRLVRQHSAIPIVILSARKRKSTMIEALDAGADSYMTKPFSIPELLARMRALLRRGLVQAKTD